MRSGFFRTSSAMLALGAAMSGLNKAMTGFGQAARDLAKRRDYEPRIKGKNRKRRGRPAVRHTTTRFDRKMARHGMIYAPGKLFKGHRI